MKRMNIPGFNAEASCYRAVNRYVSSHGGAVPSDSAKVVLQLRGIEVPYFSQGQWKTGVVLVPDDPGGWGVAFGAQRGGDAEDLHCFARCRRIVDPQRRQNCIDNC